MFLFEKNLYLQFVLFTLLVLNCTGSKPKLTVTQHRVVNNNETYRIRSIQSDKNGESYNELIGSNFVAVDLDQDGIIDVIRLGNVAIDEAQKVYELALTRVKITKKIQNRSDDFYLYVNKKGYWQQEIRSFRRLEVPAFNQFSITDNRQGFLLQTNVFVDFDADGSLDQHLKGSMDILKAQTFYTESIREGLLSEKLEQKNDTILVKE